MSFAFRPSCISIGYYKFSRTTSGAESWIFSTANNAEGWDGTLNGRFQPAGAYVWRVEYEDLLTGRPAVASGTVMMIR